MRDATHTTCSKTLRSSSPGGDAANNNSRPVIINQFIMHASSRSNHFFHLCPGISVLLHLDACAVTPVQVPVFQPMDFVMLVNVCAELVAGPAPAELPTPIALWLVVPGMRFYVVECQRFVFRVLQVFLPLPPLFIHQLSAGGFFLQYCYSLCHLYSFLMGSMSIQLGHVITNPFLVVAVHETSKRIR